MSLPPKKKKKKEKSNTATEKVRDLDLGDVVFGQLAPFEGSLELESRLWQQCVDLLGPELLAVLQDSFQTQLTSSLPASMTQGVITLLYKGKGARSSLDNYRPITLLNSDYKLLA